MEFPKTSYDVVSDIWFAKPDGTKEPSRGVWQCYAESAADALAQHEEGVKNAANPSYAWEDVQIISVMTRAESEEIDFARQHATRLMRR